jgi:hypothetical protein
MSLIVSFICGCTHEVPSKKEDLVDPVMLDTEGFVICAAHKTRRMGWRMPSSFEAGYKGELRPPWTDFEKEQWEIWGKMPDRPRAEIESSTVEDRRELRDFTTPLEKMVQKGNSRPGSARRIANRVEKQQEV